MTLGREILYGMLAVGIWIVIILGTAWRYRAKMMVPLGFSAASLVVLMILLAAFGELTETAAMTVGALILLLALAAMGIGVKNYIVGTLRGKGCL